MKALVTGATGFIGSNLVKELVASGYEVSCLARKTSDLRCLEGLEVKIFHADCTDKESLLRLPGEFTHVFHLAGLTKAGRESDFHAVNALGTENLLSVLSGKASSLSRFVYLSSLAAAGPSCEGMPLSETAEPKPVSAYGISKLNGEKAVVAWKDRIPVSIIRPPAVYGPRDRDFYLFFRMVKKGFYPYWGKCYYSLLYVDDLVDGIITAAESGEAVGRIYFLSDGGIHSNDEIISEITGALEARAIRLRIPASALDLLGMISEKLVRGTSIINSDKLKEIRHSHWTCTSQRAGKELGFVPKVTLREGIKWTADWYKIHRWI
jgi:nucleoside-diphosphate-sugar epimerase